MVYRLVIADDEEIVCEGIKNSIDWLAYGVEVVGTANNGNEALQLIKDLLPDIVISDIKMPGLNGLELVNEIKTVMPEINVILISAYEEFDYAKQAIYLGVNSYLSKPVKKVEIINEVSKIISLLEKQRLKEETLTRLQQRFVENLPILREHFLNSAIKGIIIHDVEHKFQAYQIDISPHNIGVMAFKLDNFNQANSGDDGSNDQLIMLRVIEAINENIYPRFKGITFQSFNLEIVMIFNLLSADGSPLLELINLAERVKNQIFDESGISISIGIGRVYPDFKDIGFSYKEAVKALNYRLVYGQNNVLYIENVENVETNTYRSLSHINELLDNIQNILYTGRNDEINKLIDDFSRQLQQSVNIPYFYIQQVYVQLLSITLRTATEIGIVPEKLSEHSDLYGALFQIECFEELNPWIKKIIFKVCDEINQKNKLKTKYSIQQAINYIKEHCQEEISLTTVAEYIRLSPAYFSRFFKEETGYSFVEYLKKLRIEKAKELLRTSNLKIYEICEALGYQSVQYFSNLFKNMVGVTPQEYREKG